MRSVIHSLKHLGRRLVASLAAVVIVVTFLGTLIGRVRDAVQRRAQATQDRPSRNVLPSLYDLHPEAARAPLRRIGLRAVPLEDIAGTMRHPSQNTADFLPLPKLRGDNWRARWQRITRAVDRLETLPPVDLVQVGDKYYIADGHNRVAAALAAGAVETDADVTQLIMPGVTQPGQGRLGSGSLIGAEGVRLAGAGRMSRTVEQRAPEDYVTRRDLLRPDDVQEAAPTAAPEDHE
jgi:hypothetical protein